MKRAIAIFLALAFIVACADILRSGPARDVSYPGMKVRIVQNDRHGFEITEDVAIFRARFAVMDYCEYHLNFEEHKRLAVAVAKTIANYMGSTNDIRIVHWEQPKPTDTNNIADVVNAWLDGRYVTDEIVPIRQQNGGLK